MSVLGERQSNSLLAVAELVGAVLVGARWRASGWLEMTTLSTDQDILIVGHDELMTATYARMLRLED
jgi:hypothetical protein